MNKHEVTCKTSIRTTDGQLNETATVHPNMLQAKQAGVFAKDLYGEHLEQTEYEYTGSGELFSLADIVDDALVEAGASHV